MGTMRILLAIVIVWPTLGLAQPPGRCAFRIGPLPVTPSVVRELAGVYDIEWTPMPPGAGYGVRRERLWLWRTTSTDSSLTKPSIHPAPDDTLRYLLWGTTSSGALAAHLGDSLRHATDPISPPVLLAAPHLKAGEAILLVGTIADRRPNVRSTDGAGVGVWLTHADSSGFAGIYRSWGIVSTDSGFVCARRVG